MSFGKHALINAVVLLCAGSAIAQWQDPRQPARDSLKGIKRIVVEIDYGFMDGHPDDPTEQEIQQTVEHLLKNAGITVRNRPYGTTDDDPTLIVFLFFMNFDIYYHHMSLFVTLRQPVTLPSNPSLKLTSATWEWGGGWGISTYSKRDQINEVIGEFICDFRKANPGLKGPLPNCQGDPRYKENLTKRERTAPRLMTAADEELIRAVALNEVEDVKALLAKGADANAHDPGDTTVLSYSVRAGIRRAGDTAVAEMLLNHGANPNVSVSCRLTPLMYAVNNGDLKMIQLLLDHHADANAATPEGYTPLMTASMFGSPGAVSALIQRGANVNARSRDGQTALALALANVNLIAHYDRPRFEPPYIEVPEADLLKQAQAKHAEVIQLLKKKLEQ